jgi:hypothetical protein
MESNAMPVHEQFGKENKNELFSEVKETVSSVMNENRNGEKRKFTASEMWNRHRQMRSASAMMRRWEN